MNENYKGRVIDAETGEPMIGGDVQWQFLTSAGYLHSSGTEQTGMDGRFAIDVGITYNMRMIITAHYIGYVSVTTVIGGGENVIRLNPMPNW